MSYTNPINAVGVLGVCGSVTSWTGNPSFCVYEIDAETLLPINRYTYAFDLNAANIDGKPTWMLYKDYIRNFGSFGLKSMSPSSLKHLADVMKTNSTLATAYNRLNRRRFDQGGDCSDKDCMQGRYCDAVNIDPVEHENCNKEE